MDGCHMATIVILAMIQNPGYRLTIDIRDSRIV
jgi:hypothetical protein